MICCSSVLVVEMIVFCGYINSLFFFTYAYFIKNEAIYSPNKVARTILTRLSTQMCTVHSNLHLGKHDLVVVSPVHSNRGSHSLLPFC